MALKTMLENMQRARGQIKQEAAQEIATHFKAVLPEGFELRWLQFTPYFDDGDPCVFGVHGPGLVRTAADPLGDKGVFGFKAADAIDDLPSWYRHHNRTMPTGLNTDQVERVLQAWKDLADTAGGDKRDYNTDEPAPLGILMKQAFGDHVQVRIMADGAWTTSAYEHD